MGIASASSTNLTNNQTAQIAAVQVPFIENQGQTDNQVKYYAKTFYGTVYVTNNSIVHQIKNKENNVTRVVKEEFIDNKGSAIEFQPQGKHPSTVNVSYFKGNNPKEWKTNLKSYETIDLGYLYPGIDVKLIAHGTNIEKFFYIDPGADPNQIKIRFNGVDNLTVNEEGNMIISSSNFGFLEMTKPLAFQENNSIEANYNITDNIYSYTVNAYDKNKKLIIDPTFEYNTYLGGNSEDRGYGTIDTQGNVYITGYTDSTNFPTTTGANDTNFNSNCDVFVAKLNPTGTGLIYSTYIGGTNNDFGSVIDVDTAGNVYITGYTESSDFPTTSGAYDTTFNGGFGDVFVTKLNPTGTGLIYSTYIGGTGHEEGNSIAVDALGNAYIIGTTNSTNFPTTTGAYDTSFSGNPATTFDVFVTKLNPTGTGLIYSTYIGGDSTDQGSGIAVDTIGNAYITGQTESSNFPITSGAYDTAYSGSYDVFVAKLNPTGSSLLYSTYLGGYMADYGMGITFDNLGNAYITGFTYGSFPITSGAYDTTFKGSYDVFVAKLNPTGSSLLYSTYLGGTHEEIGRSIVLDTLENVYIIGYTLSSDFPTTSGAYDTTFNGGWDVFVAELNITGNDLIYSTYLGGSNDDWGANIMVDTLGNIYLVGSTDSSDFPITSGAYDTTFNGGYDVFVAKLTMNLSDVYVATDGNDDTGDGSPEHPFQSLAKAITTVMNNGSVHIARGTYTGTNNRGLIINKNLTICLDTWCPGIGDSVIIDAEYGNRIFTINNGLNVTFLNLTLTNGNSSNSGVIYNNMSSCTVVNCTIQNSIAPDGGYGGGIYNYKGNLTVTNCNVQNNTADCYGGGIYTFSGNCTVTNCTIQNNTAKWYGGGIFNDGYGDDNCMISNCTIQNNTANYAGGGIYNNDKCTVDGCNITQNTAISTSQSVYGGGIAANAGNCTITNCTIQKNSATGPTAFGGGIYNYEGNCRITNCNIIENTATATSDTTYGGGGISILFGNCTINFNRIYNNNAATGSAIYIYSGSVNAEDNWWGSNLNPSSQFAGAGTVDYSPWLYMTLTANPTLIRGGSTSEISVSFNNAYDGVILIPINPVNSHFPNGIPVNFATTLGNLYNSIFTNN